MITATGTNGTVTLDNGMVTMTRSGVWARFSSNTGVRAIPIQQIASVQVVKAGYGRIGYIEFSYGGRKRRVIRTGTRRQNARRDENSVTFNRRQAAQFDVLRAAIENELLVQL